jgi:hypothetical protein
MDTETGQMLLAAGFTEPQRERYLELERQGRSDACLRMLRCRRCELVDALHEAQRPIDVLDWAIRDLDRRGA